MIAALLATVACGSSQKQDIRIDPDAVGSDQGTLISIGDIRGVAQIMIDSMNESPRLAALRKATNPLKVLVGQFKHRTSIAIFDSTGIGTTWNASIFGGLPDWSKITR